MAVYYKWARQKSVVVCNSVVGIEGGASDSGYIWNVYPTGFADGLVLRGRKEGS